MSNSSQLFLLCDHIKLSLLERQRAISLDIDPNPTTDSNISRSLESLREGIESLAQRSSDTESLDELRRQYNDLSRRFHGDSSTTAELTLSSPNNPTLQDDFSRAQSRTSQDTKRPQPKSRTSNLKTSTSHTTPIHHPQPQSAKAVRFRDDPSSESLDAQDQENRAALFPQRYTDEPVSTPDPTEELDNQQIHAYHEQVMAEQDEQLDRLGESIGRQRHLSMAIGDELDGQAELLEDVERGVDRQQGRLDGAKRKLNWTPISGTEVSITNLDDHKRRRKYLFIRLTARHFKAPLPGLRAGAVFQALDCAEIEAAGVQSPTTQLRTTASLSTNSRRWPPKGMTDSTTNNNIHGHNKPLVVGLTKPLHTSTTTNMTSTDPQSAEAKAALNHAIETNLQSNTSAAAPAADSTSHLPTKKKEKQPKQPKPAAPPAAPLSPALIDLRVGHILRAITHPNADSLFVSTIAMGDAEGTEHTQLDESSGKIVRTVCSGLNGLVPLEEMQDRKVVVVANLKPVTMRGIKSAAMVLAASPAPTNDSDPHSSDRVVELVSPPSDSEAGDKVFFEGWPYGDGRGPEKQLNPKKKQWEAIQPGFFTGEDLVVGFDAAKSELKEDRRGELVVDGKGKCVVKSLKGAVVR